MRALHIIFVINVNSNADGMIARNDPFILFHLNMDIWQILQKGKANYIVDNVILQHQHTFWIANYRK